MFHESSPVVEKAYYNTTKLSKKEVIEANNEALAQEGNIIEIFKKHSPLAPSDVWRIYERLYKKSILLTSVRRSITTLTKKGILTKTSIKKIGVYKRLEYVWKIN